MTNNEARKLGIPWKKILLKQQGYSCCWCGHFLSFGRATYEHIIPRSLGGTNDFANFAAAHYHCNHRRGSNMDIEPHRSPAFDFVRERIAAYKAGLLRKEADSFGPQRGTWRNDDGEIVGLSL